MLDIKSKEIVQTFEGHEGWITSVKVSADGNYIHSESLDFTTRLWDIKRGEELEVIEDIEIIEEVRLDFTGIVNLDRR